MIRLFKKSLYLWQALTLYTFLYLSFISTAYAVSSIIDVRLDTEDTVELAVNIEQNKALLLLKADIMRLLKPLLQPEVVHRLQQEGLNIFLDQAWFSAHGFQFEMNWDLFVLHITTPIAWRKEKSLIVGEKPSPMWDMPSFYVNLHTSYWQDKRWKVGSELSYQHQQSRLLARPYWTEQGFVDFPYLQWKHEGEAKQWSIGSMPTSWLPEISSKENYGVFYANGFSPQNQKAQFYEQTLTLPAAASVRVYKNKRLLASYHLQAGRYILNNFKLVEQFNQVTIEIAYDDGTHETLTDQRFMNWEWQKEHEWGWAMSVGKAPLNQDYIALGDVRYGLSEHLTLGAWGAAEGEDAGLAFLVRWKQDSLLSSIDIGLGTQGIVGKAAFSYLYAKGMVQAYQLKSLVGNNTSGLSLSVLGMSAGFEQQREDESSVFSRYNYSFNKSWLSIFEVRKRQISGQQDTALSLNILWSPQERQDYALVLHEQGADVSASWQQQYEQSQFSSSASILHNKEQTLTVAEAQYEHDDWGSLRMSWSDHLGLGLHTSTGFAMADNTWAWGKPVHDAFLISTTSAELPDDGITAFIQGDSKKLQNKALLSPLPSIRNIAVQFDTSHLPMGWSLTPEFSTFRLPKAGGIHLQADIHKAIAMTGKLLLPSEKPAKYLPLLIYGPDEKVLHSVSGSSGTIFLEGVKTGIYLISVSHKGQSYVAQFEIPAQATNLWSAGNIKLQRQ
ncbi:MAG: hypothetical protein Q9N67_05155 [Ghiorsea sp.]|nr:hypothetical protein [Ghiorsea sp.]